MAAFETDSPPPVAQLVGSKEKDFTEWFKEYTTADGNDLTEDSDIIQAVNSDDLDADFVEQQIRDSAPKGPITKGFCAKCEDLFNDWPTLGGSSTREYSSKPDPDAEGWEHGVARSWSTYELEASTRAGCKFCTFLLQQLKDSNLLDTFCKIEARLYDLNDNPVSSSSVQNWGTNPIQLLWLNLPGKLIAMTSCLMYLTPRTSGCQLALKAMNYVQATMTAHCLPDWSQ
ncbi:uncharacterized protein BDZ99DRAFT_523356 [Mytilinidion resinicola]|uniref:Uncharacterized protein n=1 Tax=Mytilinidion resinicola TaxID=574789 RepID=A0A6A6YD83_9PEZI|nr:uncharacterized protein BDZ99DRAFT_523356 [Mytilinidion resinicola]KAF2806782.1 hypothetical protein BDZ99DRAFT_523356 [Mytilinidion resinicola]